MGYGRSSRRGWLGRGHQYIYDFARTSKNPHWLENILVHRDPQTPTELVLSGAQWKFISCFHSDSHLAFEHTLRPDHLLEDVFADVWVDGGERVVQQVDVGAAVDGARQTDALLLSPAQVNALQRTTKTWLNLVKDLQGGSWARARVMVPAGARAMSKSVVVLYYDTLWQCFSIPTTCECKKFNKIWLQ